MTHLCVAIFVKDVDRARAEMALAAEGGADLIELRVDHSTEAASVMEVVRAAPVPTIVTCRPTWEGGHSELGDADRLALLAGAAEAGASYLDIELETFRRTGKLRSEVTTPRDNRSGVMASSHDFAGRP